jgi:hypothetical protein
VKSLGGKICFLEVQVDSLTRQQLKERKAAVRFALGSLAPP